MYKIFLIICILFFTSCNQDTIPKPKAGLSLEYPEKKYIKLPLKRPFSFDVLENTTLKNEQKNWLKIKYPALKASIDITYREIDANLIELLKESEKLVFKHTLKAEENNSKNYINEYNKVFGSIYEISGNAASQIQFHATDSTKHFIKGALYFYAKPNYDSILPAITYLKKDIIRLMETLTWKAEYN